MRNRFGMASTRRRAAAGARIRRGVRRQVRGFGKPITRHGNSGCERDQSVAAQPRFTGLVA